MKIPHTIPKNVLEAYRCSEETTRLTCEVDRTIRPEDVSWDEERVPSLKTLALRVIASVWKKNPILEELPTCEDRNMLMEILPTDLPFELTIRKIDNEHYWERCSRARKDKISLNEEDSCLAEEVFVHHIPLELILPQFPHLTELRINFGLVYMNDGFEWRDFEISIEDCFGLGRGIKACPKLKKFTLTRSNLDQPRAAALLQGVLENDSIEELDFSHCKLADKGAKAVGEYLSHKNLKILHLANNDIGPEGVAGIIYGLLKAEHTTLQHLNLRLNPLLDNGMFHVCAYLLRSESLEVLDVSACGIEAAGGAALAEVLTSGSIKLKSLNLNLSNNDFNETIGDSFEAALRNVPFVVGFEARMCNFSRQSEYSIHESVLRNKQRKRKEETKRMLEKSQKISIDSFVSE
ncbi:dynein regulatory complex subunit 5-like isoform X2 [Bombus bifarius]|uniref:Dynein regulatory complex subunit 5-like isoform X2 n=1 Tax=Bombus bifarius TaxID=103933 RepID=A0A6P8P072_9HYME|nr:dynein regulatory complex subunit 5-like isoform X2 [Bombus bifarius]